MNDENDVANLEVSESGSVSDSETTQTETVETMGVDYSEQFDNIYELQCWQFGLFSVFIGLFIAYFLLDIIKEYF